MPILKYWQYGLAALAILVLSCFICYRVGVSDGRKQENAEQVIIGAKEATKATSQRERIENETRKLSDPAIDARLIDNGWMRPATGR